MKQKAIPALALYLSFCAASNAAILIDDFSTAQGPLTLTTGSSNSGLPSLSAIGGARNISLDVTTENSPNTASVVVANGTLDYSNGTGVASILTVIWDGNTNATLQQNGFAPTDFTEAGTVNSFRFNTFGDFALNSVLTFYSGNNNSASVNFTLPASAVPGVYTNYSIPFANLVNSSGTFSITAVTAVTLVINGINSSDRSIDFLTTGVPPSEVPEPSTYAMIGAGALALGTLSRRRR